MNREEATPGVRVTYVDDEGFPELRGAIVDPKPDEVAYGAGYDEPRTPERHVVVWWDGERRDEASWEDPADLQRVEETS